MRNVKLFLIVGMLLSAFTTVSFAQEIPSPRKDGVSIGDTKISRNGNKLIVDYGILLGDQVLSCNVDATLILDGKPVSFSRGSKNFKGDIGIIKNSGYKQIHYDFSEQKEVLADKDISFKLNVSRKDVLKTKYLIMVAASPVTPSFGFTFGMVKRYGGYANFQSNFVFKQVAFKSDASGIRDDGDYAWLTGQGKYQSLKATAGMLFRAHKFVYPYVGLGYGYKRYLAEDVLGDWGIIKEYSSTGLAAETGIIFKAGPIAISAGIGTIKFKTVSLDLGLGVMF